MEMLLNGLQTNANKEMPSAAISDEGIKQRCIFVGLPELSTPYPSRRASELQVSSMDQEGSWRLDARLSLLGRRYWGEDQINSRKNDVPGPSLGSHDK